MVGIDGDVITVWLVTTEDKNVFVGFAGGKCTGIQRMQPIPKQTLNEAIGGSEYEKWMAKRSGTNSTPAAEKSHGLP